MRHLICIILMCFLFVADADGAAVSRQKKKAVRTEQSAGKRNSKKQTRKTQPPKKQTRKNDRSRKSVESERKRTKEQIRQTQEQIRRNNERTNRQLNALSSLNGQIKTHRDEISAIQATIDTLDSRAAILADTISRAENDVKRLREHCKRSLRQARRSRQAMTETNLVFSSKTFTEGAKRLSYLRQLERWRAKKTSDLRQGIEILSNKKKALGMLREKHSVSLAQLSEKKQQLETKQAGTKLLVDSLRRQGKSLQSVLAERQRRARALDAELDRIIEQEARRAEEQRRAEEARLAAQRQKEAARVDASSDAVPPGVDPTKKNDGGKNSRDAKKTEYPGRADEERRLSGSFVSNKGRLLFPVAGKYNITSHFGRNSHSELSRVEINNPGIDIEVPAGSSARAVFDGTVSYIFRMDGYQNVVMVRHGSYLTVYAHIDGLSVKKGDKVKAGQSLGSIFADPTNGGRATLHFEVRNEREKLNPLQWVR